MVYTVANLSIEQGLSSPIKYAQILILYKMQGLMKNCRPVQAN